MPAERYVPAAGRRWLTRLYDPVLALSMREHLWRPVILAAALADPVPRVVLDVGCGSGTLCVGLAQANRAVRILGIDGDEEILARARVKTARFGERVQISPGLADALPVADSSVDVAIASLLLHHLGPAAKLRCLREASRALAPGGRLIVADWGPAHDPLMKAAFLSLRALDGFANTRDHGAGRLPSLLAEAGFEKVTVRQRWRTVWGSLETITAESR